MIQIDMDMPSYCYDCDFSIGVMSTKADRECTITDKYVNDDDKPEWCPMIDVPEMNVGNISEIPNRSTDCISRQTAIDALKAIKYGLWEIDIPSPGNSPEYIEHHKQIKDMMEITDGWIKKLMELPPVQPETILCKDCTWCQNDTVHGKVFCSREGAMDWIEPDSYCSYGERETDD